MAVSAFQIDGEGFFPLSLGMSRHEIDQILTETPRVDRANLKGESAFRYASSQIRVVMREDRAVEIALVPPTKVLFRGRSLFDDRSVWRELVATDGSASEVVGFVILRQLGLTLTGFHDGDSAQLAVTAFQTGRWDMFESKMQPLRM